VGLLFQFTTHAKVNTKKCAALANKTDTGIINENVVMVKYPKLWQIIATGFHSKNLFCSYKSFVTVLRVLFFYAPITLNVHHTWSNRLNFRKEKADSFQTVLVVEWTAVAVCLSLVTRGPVNTKKSLKS